MPASANPGTPIVSVASEFSVEAGEVSGRVVAMQFTGNAMLYLVVNDAAEMAPVWVGENEVTRAY